MAENICSEVAEPAQTSTVLSQLHPGLPGWKTKQNKTHAGAEKL